MVSGTVTVSDESVVIAAQNSKGKNINITINLAATGLKEMVSEMNGKTEKAIHNGKLIIMHNGRLFNALGAEIR